MTQSPHVLIVEARFYEDIANELVKGAVAYLEGLGVSYEKVTVPGALEIPAVISCAVATNQFAGYVALGCVIRGETTHYDYVCGESARGLNEIAIRERQAIGNGILTVENREQAMVRAKVDQKNKGKSAAEACMAMVNIKRQFGL